MSGLSGTSLAQLQSWMLGALRTPATIEQHTLDAILMPGAQLGARDCLSIYQRSYRLRLMQCLGDQFPATRHALGDDLFNDFALEYLGDCPSNSYTLYDLGARFSEWLEQHRPDRDLPVEGRESWIDFMVDLATYEWALFRLFDAPGAEELPWPTPNSSDDSLRLQPCLTLLQCRYPVADYYHSVRAKKMPEFPELQHCYYVIARRNFKTATYGLSQEQFTLIKAIQKLGCVESAICDISNTTGNCISNSLVKQRWNALKQSWIEKGFFIET